MKDRFNNQIVFGWENAIKGMRYSFDSEDQSDSRYEHPFIYLGEKDRALIFRLIKGGSEHRIFLRAIHIQLSANMTMTWWKQYDTYKVSTTALSRSTMHTITKNKLTEYNFRPYEMTPAIGNIIEYINELIDNYNKLKTLPKANPEDLRRLFNQIIDILPGSFLQERMLDLNYETALNIIKQRKHHKLRGEWGSFCDELLSLPYMKIFYEELKSK